MKNIFLIHKIFSSLDTSVYEFESQSCFNQPEGMMVVKAKEKADTERMAKIKQTIIIIRKEAGSLMMSLSCSELTNHKAG